MRGLALTLRKHGRGEEALTTARETATILGTWGGTDHPGALDAGMDALELAILLDRPHHHELVALTEPISALPAGHVRACRFASLNELAAIRPDLRPPVPHWTAWNRPRRRRYRRRRPSPLPAR